MAFDFEKLLPGPVPVKPLENLMVRVTYYFEGYGQQTPAEARIQEVETSTRDGSPQNTLKTFQLFGLIGGNKI